MKQFVIRPADDNELFDASHLIACNSISTAVQQLTVRMEFHSSNRLINYVLFNLVTPALTALILCRISLLASLRKSSSHSVKLNSDLCFSIAKGEHLLRVVKADDYLVMIEDVNCSISYINDTSLWFSPTVLSAPDPTVFSDVWNCPSEYPYHLVVI
jgi:hypothetical protein